jgi:hypothetical protein
MYVYGSFQDVSGHAVERKGILLGHHAIPELKKNRQNIIFIWQFPKGLICTSMPSLDVYNSHAYFIILTSPSKLYRVVMILSYIQLLSSSNPGGHTDYPN